MRRIKILQISQATDGVQKHILSLVSRIDKDRFEVVGCCPRVDRIPGVSLNKSDGYPTLQISALASDSAMDSFLETSTWVEGQVKNAKLLV